ncbi:MAG: hypothetical protein NTW31_04535 [Bacteroidetes bacterium]|nr:hypothetical protein [Bacteroidota bacterium]
MKTFIWKLSLLVLLVIAIIAACKKSTDNSGSSAGLTDAEKTAITNTYSQISSTLNNSLLDTNAIQRFNQNLASIKQLPQVENAWIKDSALFVKFSNAGLVFWYIPNKYLIPPYGYKAAGKKSGTRIPVGNNKACLINQQYNDESRQYCKDIINTLDQEFIDNGYETTIVNGGDVNLSFLQNDLFKYGAIFFISHGAYDGTRTWIVTGEEPPNAQDNPLQKLLNDQYLWWNQGLISAGTVHEERNGHQTAVTYYAFSDKYVSDAYADGAFPSSLIYLVACQSFKGTTQLAQAYHLKGVGVTIGWDETNCAGQSTGKMLFDLLLGGLTVDSAFFQLPDDAKNDYCAVPAGAHLTYYPPAGKDICLVGEKKAEIIITSLHDGETITSRVLSLEGYMDSVQSVTNGVVEINGVPTILRLDDGTHFSQSIVIQNGPNTIKVTGYGKQANGNTVTATKKISVNGNFPTLDIFTELRWNTNYSDIDFHMLPPGGTIDDLWTSSDCYYSNKSPSWGGVLDVDNTYGYGPEHITVPIANQSGSYRLFVHYYKDHGGGVTQAFVDVGVKDGPLKHLGPYTLVNNGGNESGDVWEACTIDFPSGTITPVNKYYYLGPKFKSSNLPQKGK